MKYSPEFYYMETHSGIEYTKNPSGSLAVSETLRQGRVLFIDSCAPLRRKPKTLLIADWTARNWSSEKSRSVRDRLAELLEDNFLIYRWSRGEILPFCRRDLPLLETSDVRHAMIPVYPDELIALASVQQSLSRDKLFVLDDYWIQYMLDKSPRTLRVSDLWGLDLEDAYPPPKGPLSSTQQKMMAILQDAQPPVKTIYHDIFYTRANLLVDIIRKTLPNAELIRWYQAAKISSNDLMLFERDLSLRDGHSELDVPCCTTILTMELNPNSPQDPIPAQALQTFLKTTPQLETLTLHGSRWLGPLYLPDASLTYLKRLHCDCPMSTTELDSLLRAAPKIIDLQLGSTVDFSAPFSSIAATGFRALEQLNCSYSAIPIEKLQTILEKATQLKTLDLGGCSNLSGVLTLKEASLLQLERLMVNNETIAISSVFSLLKAAPHLKFINMMSLKLPDEMPVPHGILSRLESMLWPSTISGTNASTLLRANPHFKKWTGAMNITEGELLLEPASLLDLTSICLNHGSQLSMKSLATLLAAASHIDTLNLCNMKLLPGDFHLEPSSLPLLVSANLMSRGSFISLNGLMIAASNLKKLMCHGQQLTGVSVEQPLPLRELTLDGDIQLDTLSAFLKQTPHIHELVFSTDANASDSPFTLKPQCLASLITISILNGVTGVRMTALHALLTAAPALKILRLYDFTIQSDAILDLKPHALPYLDSLLLSCKALPSASLSNLLSATSRLRYLRLHGQSIEGGDFAITPNDLPRLKKISFYDCTISTQNFNALIKAAPLLKKVYIGSTQLSPDAVLTLLSTANKLQKIEFGTLVSMEFEGIRPNSLPLLEDFRSVMPISNPSLQALLKAAPSMKRLRIRSQASSSLVLDAGSLQSLETIHLEDYYDGTIKETLLALLDAAPRLKKLDVSTIQFPIDAALQARLDQIETVSLPQPRASSEPIPVPTPTPHSDSLMNPPPYNPSTWRHFQPTPDDAPFIFRGQNNTQDQGMIIEKLSQYLSLKKRHLALIPRLQDGICAALSHYFIHLHQQPSAWLDFMQVISAWNGSLPALDRPLINYLDTLLIYTMHYQGIGRSSSSLPNHLSLYVGDNLDAFLDTLPENAASVLVNPWHAIAVKHIAQGAWLVYDPNFIAGCREVHQREALLGILHMAIGELVSVQSTDCYISPAIKNPARFIEHGGLLALAQSNNTKAMLALLPAALECSANDLDGLLLRDTRGTPVWVRGLNNPSTSDLTINLLTQFMTKNPNFSQPLQYSITQLSAYNKHDLLAKLIQLAPKASSSPSPLIDIIREAPLQINPYHRPLQTWVTRRENDIDIKAYCHAICQAVDITNRLIKLSSEDGIEGLRYALARHCKTIQKPVYYIHSPDELVCSRAFMIRNRDHTGELKAGPGGMLHDFLTSNESNTLLLIVNYDTFKADDIVRLNTLLDKDPRADGTPLPRGTQIVGLINQNNPSCYQGADFYSRFDRTEEAPIADTPLLDAIPTLPLMDAPSSSSYAINLYHADNWEELLLGRWILNGNQFTYQEGLLRAAVASGEPIHIENGPWRHASFRRFWKEALLGGVVNATQHGHEIPIPRTLSLSQANGYTWEAVTTHIKPRPGLSSDVSIVVNPSLFNRLFVQYDCNPETQSLITADGLVKTHAHQTLSVNITRSLSEDQWARLLAECVTHQVHLVAYYADGVVFPWNPDAPAASVFNTPVSIICSTDVDTTVKQHVTPGTIIIDVLECDATDLLSRMDGQVDDTSLQLRFSKTACAVSVALEKGTPLILKGLFSAELADELAPLLINPSTPSSLCVVTADPTPFRYLPIHQHTVTSDEKKAALGALDESALAFIEPYLHTESFSQLNARLYRLQQSPLTSASDPWLGLYDIPPEARTLPPIDLSESEMTTTRFTSQRKAAVLSILQDRGHVFLTGLSGVGKSTFVEKELASPNDTLYVNESALSDWAHDTNTAGYKLLFLDEANLSPRQWLEFEGLFNEPPCILIKGELIPLDPYHKVVFAGNPVNYGGERALAAFFKRHAQTVLFEPLPPSVIYEKVLKPVFAGTLLEERAGVISQHLLAIYRFLCNASTTDVLISPRELQMMALLICDAYKREESQDLQKLTALIAYYISKQLAPPAERTAFDNEFKPLEEDVPHAEYPDSSFLITPSRLATINQLDALFHLQDARKQEHINEAQRYGGLGGIVLEGEPGIGKSELVVQRLIAKGYQEVHCVEEPAECAKPFYRMPVSLSTGDKEKLLLQAFHEGAVVMIDEINSSPMMERLLNDLLMGMTPQKERPRVPGFMIIGTQNPISMEGRRASSTALTRRLTTIQLPPYSKSEMKAIFLHKGLREADATALVSAYKKQGAFAKEHHLSPAPTFRDALRLADAVIRGYPTPQTPIDSPKNTNTGGLHTQGFFSRPPREMDPINPTLKDPPSTDIGSHNQ